MLHHHCLKQLFNISLFFPTGDVEIMLYKKLLTKFPNIHACALEPRQEELERYQQKITKDPIASQLHGMTYDFQNCTIEEYMNAQGDKQRYHFISSIDSIYYVKDLKNTLQYLYDILAPGGILLMHAVTGR